MPGLSDDQVAAFLDEPGHLARIATTDVDGMPRVLPLWFVHIDGRILFCGEHTHRHRYAHADGAMTTGIREAKRLLRSAAVTLSAG